jgi:phage-related protein
MWQIHFYEDHRGKSPGLDFINGLSPMDRARVNNGLRLLEEFGIDLGMPHARRIEGRLRELRPGGNRLFYFLYTERRFVILHGFRKQSMKTPEKEIATALRRMKELLED